MEQNKYDVVIIGGGLAGLCAAVLLAQKGEKVAILEKRKEFGGRASTKEVSGSFFNLGPHALYKKGNVVKLLHSLNIKLNGGTPSTKGSVYYENKKFELPSNIVSIFKTKLLSWAEKKEFIRLMLKIGTINTANLHHQTLQQWAEDNIHSIKNRELFYTFSRLACYVNAPHIVNAGAVLNQLKLSLGGAIYVNRGWQSFIQQLLEKAKKLGVTLLSDCSVDKIDFTNQVKQIHFKRNEQLYTFKSPWALLTVPPNEIMRIVKDIDNSPLSNVLNQCIPVKAACLDVSLNTLTNSSQHFSLDMNHGYYYSNHSNAAKLSYHPNHHVIHVMKYLAPNESSSIEELSSFLDNIQPSWERFVVTKRFLPNLTVTHRIPTTSPINISELAANEFPGLLLAGEWVSNDFLLAEAAITTIEASVQQILFKKEFKKIG